MSSLSSCRNPPPFRDPHPLTWLLHLIGSVLVLFAESVFSCFIHESHTLSRTKTTANIVAPKKLKQTPPNSKQRESRCWLRTQPYLRVPKDLNTQVQMGYKYQSPKPWKLCAASLNSKKALLLALFVEIISPGFPIPFPKSTLLLSFIPGAVAPGGVGHRDPVHPGADHPALGRRLRRLQVAGGPRGRVPAPHRRRLQVCIRRPAVRDALLRLCRKYTVEYTTEYTAVRAGTCEIWDGIPMCISFTPHDTPMPTKINESAAQNALLRFFCKFAVVVLSDGIPWDLRYRWVTLYPNTLNSKLGFICFPKCCQHHISNLHRVIQHA